MAVASSLEPHESVEVARRGAHGVHLRLRDRPGHHVRPVGRVKRVDGRPAVDGRALKALAVHQQPLAVQLR